jgi:hypothetical protein
MEFNSAFKGLNTVKELEGNTKTGFEEIDCGDRNWVKLVQNYN